MRPVFFSYDDNLKCIFASSNRGTILKFDSDLNFIASSAPIYNLNSLYMMKVDSDYIYAREITGKLVRWHKDTLALDQMIDLTHWSDPDHADVPNVSHGLFFWEQYVYVSMPQGRMGKFLQSDLSFVGLSSYLPKALLECVEMTDPNNHFAVDFSGYLYRGHLDNDFEMVTRIAHGACHQIVYDRKFKRYWVTDDFHCGLALFSTDKPSQIKRIFLTVDDVERMSFSRDQSEVLVACFDRYIYRIRNEEEPKVIARLGPLKYQVTQVEWVDAKTCYALTESGEIYRIDVETNSIHAGPTGTNAVWDIKKTPTGSYWTAFEDGFIREIEVSGVQIKILREKNLGLGMIRRLCPLPDGGLLALATNGRMVRVSDGLNIQWVYETAPLLRDFALHGTCLLVCAETGELSRIDVTSGTLLWRRNFEAPLWTLSIDPTGEQYIVSERVCDRTDQNRESTGRHASVHIGLTATGQPERRESFLGNIKKITWLSSDQILINGNGSVATSKVRWPSFEVEKQWSQWQLNTCEAALQMDDRIYTTTYGYQLNTFDVNGEILESAFPFEDYATTLVSVGDNCIMAGGRGAFLSLFTLRDGLPQLATTKRF